MLSWVVKKEEAGNRLLSFLTKHLGTKFSTKSLKRLIENNGCQINGRVERFASTLLGPGDHVVLHAKKELFLKIAFEKERILYEDEALIAYDKPAGITCDTAGILSLLQSYVRPLQLIHRLDKETTGVLLFAKKTIIYEKMVEQFRGLLVHKLYVAIVDGKMNEPKGQIEDYMAKKKEYAGQAIWGAVPPSQGVYARTDWELISFAHSTSLIACYPKTGRTHQIRVHLAKIGHPVLGDVQYGKKFSCLYHPPRILLHAKEIRFFHPETAQELCITAPLPSDFTHAYSHC